MNILVVGKFYTEGFALHISETLQEMGHEVVKFQPGKKYFIIKNKLNQYISKARTLFYDIYSRFPLFEKRELYRLLKTAKGQDIHLVIVCHDFLTPHQIHELKRASKAKVILWFPDAIANFRKAMFLNGNYDALFFKDPYIVIKLKNELGLSNIYYLPEACNPKYHNLIEIESSAKSKYEADIVTAGNLHTARIEFFKNLKKYNVKIWGNRPPHWAEVNSIEQMIMSEYVVNQEKSKAFAYSKIAVNNLHPSEVIGVNVRAFEIAATGTFQLINYRSGLHQLFEVGKEIETYKNIKELKDKINYFLVHENERKEIANRGYLRVQQDHIYEKRLELLLNTVFGKENGFKMLSRYHL